jgi:hypothetical protein
MHREPRGVDAEDLLPDPSQEDEPSHHPLEERRRGPQHELLYGREMREPGEAQLLHQGVSDGEEVVDVLPVRLPHPLPEDQQGDVLPLGEVPPGELAGVERDALPPADLEDRPDHPHAATDPPPLPVVVLPVLPRHTNWGESEGRRQNQPSGRILSLSRRESHSNRILEERVSTEPLYNIMTHRLGNCSLV